MTDELQRFILSNQELIDNNAFSELFGKVHSAESKQELSEILLSAGIDFLSYMTVVPNMCFYKSDIKKITFPNSIVDIGNRSFYHCVKLQEVTFDNNLRSIGPYAFSKCISLQAISIPPNVKNYL